MIIIITIITDDNLGFFFFFFLLVSKAGLALSSAVTSPLATPTRDYKRRDFFFKSFVKAERNIYYIHIYISIYTQNINLYVCISFFCYHADVIIKK